MPGVILAIMLPGNHLPCSTAMARRRVFFEVKIELGLDNLQVVNSRVKLFPDQTFDVVPGIQFTGGLHRSDGI